MLTAERQAAEEDIAQDYARMLRQGGTPEQWKNLNANIIETWSVSALRRIKRRAWLINGGTP